MEVERVKETNLVSRSGEEEVGRRGRERDGVDLGLMSFDLLLGLGRSILPRVPAKRSSNKEQKIRVSGRLFRRGKTRRKRSELEGEEENEELTS